MLVSASHLAVRAEPSAYVANRTRGESCGTRVDPYAVKRSHLLVLLEQKAVICLLLYIAARLVKPLATRHMRS